ncbi:hypothetical protein AXG89_33960 [Burkholderia sp. PAMC 26561]|nr:hypothetical protein AXG89_33960 [Burkholderia sp. PAMC 26561]
MTVLETYKDIARCVKGALLINSRCTARQVAASHLRSFADVASKLASEFLFDDFNFAVQAVSRLP